MPGPYKMRGPAFVGAGHAPPAFNDFEIYSIRGGVALFIRDGVSFQERGEYSSIDLRGSALVPSAYAKWHRHSEGLRGSFPLLCFQAWG